MTRIVLCNSIPAIFDDPAVQDRTHTIYVIHPLFMLCTKRKFRGTHLLDNYDVFDNENDDEELVKEFACSYGSVSVQALIHDKQYEEKVRFESSELRASESDETTTGHTLSEDQMNSLQEQSLVLIR